MTTETKYPEHEKLRSIKSQSQAIGEFLEWLQDSAAHGDAGMIVLGYYPYITHRPRYNEDLEVSGYDELDREDWERSSELQSYTYNTQKLLAEFFGIDLNKLEDEKQQMLDEMRKSSS